MQRKTVASCALLLLAATQATDAQTVGPSLDLGQKAALNVSGFWADINTVARADGSGGRVGTRLNLERDLGLDDQDLRFIGGLSYQFNRRHGLELSYFDLRRSA